MLPTILRRTTVPLTRTRAVATRIYRRNYYAPSSSRVFDERPICTTSTQTGVRGGCGEFDVDHGEFVTKEVSVHDRRQSQLSDEQKKTAQEDDYSTIDGDAPSRSMMRGQSDEFESQRELFDPEEQQRQAGTASAAPLSSSASTASASASGSTASSSTPFHLSDEENTISFFDRTLEEEEKEAEQAAAAAEVETVAEEREARDDTRVPGGGSKE